MINLGDYHQQIRTATAQAPIQFEKQLKSMGFDFSQIQNLIQMVNQDAMCDEECQRQKRLNELQDKLNKAKKTQEDAPFNVDSATKDYYTFKEGEQAYIRKMRQEYTRAAKEEINSMKAEFIGRADTVEQQIQKTAALEVYINNMEDLLNLYITKNQRLTKAIDKIRGTLVTDDRKAFYLGQKWSWETYVVWFLKLVYWVITSFFVFYYVLYLKNYRNKRLIGMSVGLVSLPFVIHYLLTFSIMGYSIQSILDNFFRPWMSIIEEPKFPTNL